MTCTVHSSNVDHLKCLWPVEVDHLDGVDKCSLFRMGVLVKKGSCIHCTKICRLEPPNSNREWWGEEWKDLINLINLYQLLILIWFLDAIASPGTYSCRWVGQSVSNVFRFWRWLSHLPSLFFTKLANRVQLNGTQFENGNSEPRFTWFAGFTRFSWG